LGRSAPGTLPTLGLGLTDAVVRLCPAHLLVIPAPRYIHSVPKMADHADESIRGRVRHKRSRASSFLRPRAGLHWMARAQVPTCLRQRNGAAAIVLHHPRRAHSPPCSRTSRPLPTLRPCCRLATCLRHTRRRRACLTRAGARRAHGPRPPAHAPAGTVVLPRSSQARPPTR
jgi:hypothetical protein